MKYIDIGLNLFSKQFAGREEEILKRAGEMEVSFIITGSSIRSSEAAARFSEAHEGVYCTAGIHPHEADTASEDALRRIRRLLDKPCVIAAGECGLDYDRMYSPKEAQLKCFERHLVFAEECGKVLFLHERAASEDFTALMKEHAAAAERSVVHCFTGTAAEAEGYLSLGCMIGITGWICDERRNGDLKDALKTIPVDRLMAETDGPYLLPRGIKGLKNPNLPENVVYVVRKIAELKDMDEEELRTALLENTKRFFGI